MDTFIELLKIIFVLNMLAILFGFGRYVIRPAIDKWEHQRTLSRDVDYSGLSSEDGDDTISRVSR